MKGTWLLVLVVLAIWCYVTHGMAVDGNVAMNQEQELQAGPKAPNYEPNLQEVANAIKDGIRELRIDPDDPKVGPNLKEVVGVIIKAADKKVTTCGGTATDDAKDCVFPFTYNGIEYQGCTTVDYDQLWCATQGGAFERHNKWGNCECVNEEPLPVTTCGGTAMIPNNKCVFPFIYNKVEYFSCTNVDHDRPWCATQSGDISVHNKWGNCFCGDKLSTCGGSAGGAPCSFPFTYGGKSYSSCTSTNHNQPWCSTTPTYTSQWGNCRCSPPKIETCGGSAGDGVTNDCFFPFYYKGQLHYNCIKTNDRPNEWCGTSSGDVEEHGNFGFCGSCK